ncbi:MAG: hypothetical protein K2W96_26225 [Gemmataceae bacterium]|nr:hypothetical protein [Gemmataceae bacterium]
MAEKALRWLLRAQAVLLLCALPAAVMPTEWMDAAHRWLGMGPLPRAPLTEYLTRSVSMVYAAWGVQLALMAHDVRRYLPMVRLFGWMEVAGAAAFGVLDALAGLPLAWTLGEAGMLLALGGSVVILVRGVEARYNEEPG